MSTAKNQDTHQLDAMTGGAFSAPTSGERAARVREWLATQPSAEQMQEVFRELSGRDKGAARLLRERLDEIKRAKGQETIAAEWADKAQALLGQPRLNIADAMAWQRDAAKAGAPLSREPLAGFKSQLAERIRGIEDLQNRVQVQREAAVLLAQRIEVLSTKPWRDAQAGVDALRADVEQWQGQAQGLLDDANWASVDTRFPPLLDASRGQLQAVWDAFQSALAQAVAAAEHPEAPLPPVPVWADELRQARGLPPEAAAAPAKPAKPKVDPEQRARANAAVSEAVVRLEQQVAEGHAKQTAGAATALRNALKEHGKLLDEKVEAQANAALAAAGELEGWQRWRADQLRMELVAKAEALFETVPVKGPAQPRPPKAKGAQGGKGADGGAGRPAPAAVTGAAAAPGTETAETMALSGAEMEGSDATGTGEVPPAAAPSPAPGPVTVTGAAAAPGTPTAEAMAATGAEMEGEDATSSAAEGATATPQRAGSAVDEAGAPAAEGSATSADEAVATTAAGTPVGTVGAIPGTPAAAQQAGAEAGSPVAAVRRPRYGGRKMQETLRQLREQWKQVDQGGPPNHALWKRFDEACNEAYKVVQEWLDKVKAEAQQNKSARLALIEEVRAWGAAHAGPQQDWKAFNRALHQFGDRWREAGHLSEKAFAELQPQWKAVLAEAGAPLAAAQKGSIERRQAMIEEANALGEAPQLRIDAVRGLQQRWQAEAQSVPLDRKQEQRLWDAFRKPIDDAFNRKSAEREKAAAAMSDHDRAVLEASKALEAANASGDAQRIRTAMTQLEQAIRGAREAAAAAPASAADERAPAAGEAAVASAEAGTGSEGGGSEASAGSEGGASAEGGEGAAEAPAPAPAKAPPKPVIAMRGDDRPGARRPEPAPAARGGKFDPRRPGPGGRDARGGERRAEGRGFGRDDRGFGRDDREPRGPRLGDAAFRAQRDAIDHAQAALRKLAAQAHGEALTQLLAAWEQRAADQVPSQQELGRAVAPAVRTGWTQALGQSPSGEAGQVLLRLEIAADVPSPGDQMSARRMLQLQLLTKRNDPSPQETWGADVAKVLATPYDANAARRLQNALKALLRR